MIFAPDMVALVLAGEKTVTRRPVTGDPCRYVVGRTYAVQPGRGQRAVARIRVLKVDAVRTFPISYEEARAEGFSGPVAFETRWHELHGEPRPGFCWRIEFEVTEIIGGRNDVTVAAIPETILYNPPWVG